MCYFVLVSFSLGGVYVKMGFDKLVADIGAYEAARRDRLKPILDKASNANISTTL